MDSIIVRGGHLLGVVNVHSCEEPDECACHCPRTESSGTQLCDCAELEPGLMVLLHLITLIRPRVDLLSQGRCKVVLHGIEDGDPGNECQPER